MMLRISVVAGWYVVGDRGCGAVSPWGTYTPAGGRMLCLILCCPTIAFLSSLPFGWWAGAGS